MAKKPKNVARKHRHWQRWLKITPILVFGFIILNLAINLAIRWPINQQKPIDAILVLGGSIRREIYVANLAQQYPDIPILISQGSKDPCILLLFERAKAPKTNVWLEKCADSTFGNFFFAVPILKQWGVHKVKVVTSPTHLPRAKWLAEIHLQSHGIAVEIDAVREIGIPGNHESKLKTGLDVTRSIIWAFVGQLIYPRCWQVIPLNSVDLEAWHDEGFQCESQGKLSGLIAILG
jgi:uncharacterized SAM-binding protein YcdF (DUF218 family)